MQKKGERTFFKNGNYMKKFVEEKNTRLKSKLKSVLQSFKRRRMDWWCFKYIFFEIVMSIIIISFIGLINCFFYSTFSVPSFIASLLSLTTFLSFLLSFTPHHGLSFFSNLTVWANFNSIIKASSNMKKKIFKIGIG